MKSGSGISPLSSKLRVLRNAIGKQVVLRTLTERFARPASIEERLGVLIEIHVEDGTVTVQDVAGDLHRVARWEWITQDTPGTFWHWVDADPPEDPKGFKPTHPFRGGPPAAPKPRAA